MSRPLTGTDPLPTILTALRAHAGVTTTLGGPTHVGGRREAPWPHLQVTLAPGANLGNGRNAARIPVDLTVWGHPDGRDSSKALRDAAVTALEALLELADAPYTPGGPVISQVILTNGPDKQDTTAGQRRWFATAEITVTPPV